MTQRKVIVIGEGPAGLMAAGQAALAGAQTILLGKMDRVGIKLSITGNGRCNLTNTLPLPQFIERFGKNGKFLRQIFSRFFTADLIEFFRKLGVETVVEKDGCVFPKSGRADDIVNYLVQWAKDAGVIIKLQFPVSELVVENVKIKGVYSKETFFPADAVILAAGGASYPKTGSSGDGFRLAESIGHKIVPIRPALVPIETDGPLAKQLQAVTLPNINVTLLVDGKKSPSKTGDLLFTHFGLSGPVILSISKTIYDSLHVGKKVSVSIDTMPNYDKPSLDKKLIQEFVSNGKRYINNLLKNFIPSRLADTFCELGGINTDTLCCRISCDERKKLCDLLKDFRFDITRTRPLAEAIVTAGGIDLKEIDPRTLSSKLIDGLYFAGEVMDIDGDTGGFNLQAAFSTGFVAGSSAAIIS